MNDRIKIVDVGRVDGYGLIIDFSDNSTARYIVEELINLRPARRQIQDELDEIEAMRLPAR
jgi:hypothetical protein